MMQLSMTAQVSRPLIKADFGYSLH